jgi:hypothetical protein
MDVTRFPAKTTDMAKRVAKFSDTTPFSWTKVFGRKKAYGMTPADLRELAAKIERLSRRIHNVADKMDLDRVPGIVVIPQGLVRIVVEDLPQFVKDEIEDRYADTVALMMRKQATAEAKRRP